MGYAFGMPLNKLNSQQRAAVTAEKGLVRVVAGAGTGKTSCLTAKLAYEVQKGMKPDKILALTFTKKAGLELKHRLRSTLGVQSERIFAGTFHSYAHQHLCKVLTYSLITDNDVSDIIEHIAEQYGELEYSTQEIMSLLGYHRNLQKPYSDPILQKIEVEYKQVKLKNNLKDYDDLLEDFLILLQKKLFKFSFDLICCDEAQDNCRLQVSILKELISMQPTPNAFIIGDAMQCLPAGTLISDPNGVRPIETVCKNDLVYSSTGNTVNAAKVTDVFTKHFSGYLIEIKTKTGSSIKSTADHTHFAGYLPKETTSPKHFVYLMYKCGYGFRLGKTQQYINSRNTIGLKMRTNQEGADSLWVISAHNSDAEARLQEATLAANYGLPTAPFRHRRGGFSQEHIDSLFQTIPTYERAKKLLEDNLMFIEAPTHFPKASFSNRRTVTITLCGDVRQTLHRISCHGSNLEDAKKLSDYGFSIRKDHRKCWRYETSFKSYENLIEQAHKIKSLIGARINQTCRFNGVTLPFCPASHVKPGMFVMTTKGLDEVVSTKVVKYEGPVYDLNIEASHNFIANDIFTHNSIYSWRGADLESFLNWGKLGAKDFPLAINYRSTKEVIKIANKVLGVMPGEARVNLVAIKDEEAAPVKIAKVGNSMDEVIYVTDKIRELHAKGHPYHSMCILYRAHYLSNNLQLKLADLRIPYNVWSGQNMLTASHIQDCICFLRAYTNPRDVVAWARVFRNLPKVGKVTGQKMAEAVIKCGIHAYENPVAEPIKRIFGTASSEHFINAVMAFYLPIVRENFPNSTKDQGVIKFLDFARSHKDLRQFVIDIMFTEKAETAENPGVTLTTIHQAKGLEWENVFVTGIYDGAFPSAKAEDPSEEFRLFYVALTRAKTNLFCTFPEQSIGQWSKPTTSIFFDILTGKLSDPNAVAASMCPGPKKQGR